MSAILLEQASSLGMALTPSIGGARAALARCLTFVQCDTVPVFGAVFVTRTRRLCMLRATACIHLLRFISSAASNS